MTHSQIHGVRPRGRLRLHLAGALPVLGLIFALLHGCPGCGGPQGPERPNVLWILWDTVRADRLSLYGYEKPTTPFLEQWARDALVFEDCVSTANYTVPAHASFFTGLLTSQHGAQNGRLYLDDEFTTIAEVLQSAGYRTYLYSANPHIAAEENFDQGFDLSEHPWDPKYRQAAYEIVSRKISPQDQTSRLPEKIRRGQFGNWDIKASGELAQRGLRDWLRVSDDERPFFAFLNYMEAHRPYIPAADYRARMMSPDQVAQSYQINRGWVPQWSYTFGLAEYSPEEIAITSATYDATIAELDDLFADLIHALEADGALENTIIILTSDHGEHLGEHHMLGHQLSVYNPLIRVPLIIHYPERFAPARDSRPVMNYDLVPTLLDLAGIEQRLALAGGAVSLPSAPDSRVRVVESLGVFRDPMAAVKRAYPEWDPATWDRELRAVISGTDKLIWASNGDHELYRYPDDAFESVNRIVEEPELAASLAQTLADFLADLGRQAGAGTEMPELPPEHLERLRSLGYIDIGGKPDTAAEATEDENPPARSSRGEETQGQR
ncbi:MAG: sulfatase [Candidatus Eisenbacteria sp.]|nr:sulfatase [Candidatus Eisenbacteria bacterium]